MNRYSSIPLTSTEENPKPRYSTVKYPTIKLDFGDIYVYTTVGDRYDILSQQYYGDSSLWWIISKANYSTNQDSIIPIIGTQIRIPAPTRVSVIISDFEILNK
jgi:hypothetical protein